MSKAHKRRMSDPQQLSALLFNRNVGQNVLDRLNNQALGHLARASRRHRNLVRAIRPLPGGGILNPSVNSHRTTRLPTARDVATHGVDPTQQVLNRTPGVLKPYRTQPPIDFSVPRQEWAHLLKRCLRRQNSPTTTARIARGLREMYWGLRVRGQAAAAREVKPFVDEYSRQRRQPNLTRLRAHVPEMSKIAIFLTLSQFLPNIGGMAYVGQPIAG